MIETSKASRIFVGVVLFSIIGYLSHIYKSIAAFILWHTALAYSIIGGECTIVVVV